MAERFVFSLTNSVNFFGELNSQQYNNFVNDIIIVVPGNIIIEYGPELKSFEINVSEQHY